MEIIDKHPAFDFDFDKIRSHLFSDECSDYLSGIKYLNAVEAKLRRWERNTLCDKNKDGLYEAILDYWPRIYVGPVRTLKDRCNIGHLKMHEIEMLIAQAKEEDLFSSKVGAFSETVRAAFEMVINRISSKIDDLKQELEYLRDTEQISQGKSEECPTSYQNTVHKVINKESENELEEIISSNSAFGDWERFGSRLGLVLGPRKTVKLFYFLEGRGFIESLTFYDGKLKWMKIIPLLKGFLQFLCDEEVLSPRDIKNAVDCFLDRHGNLIPLNTLHKKGKDFPLKDEVKKIIAKNIPLLKGNFHEQ